MSTAHTPGPWATIEVGDRVTALAVMDSTRQSILTLVEEDGVTFAAVLSDADARLIAAAPDLLASLQAVLGHFDKASYDAFSLAAKAIAKATGSAA